MTFAPQGRKNSVTYTIIIIIFYRAQHEFMVAIICLFESSVLARAVRVTVLWGVIKLTIKWAW